MKLYKIAIALLALSVALIANCAASAASFECNASVIDVVPIRTHNGGPAPMPDVYAVLKGLLDVSEESVFKVYRPSEVNDESVRHYPLMLYVGRLRVVEVQDEVLIGRMIEFASDSEHPRVRYPDVMIGDCLRLESLESEEEPVVEIEEATAPEEPPAPPEPQVIPTRILFEFDSAVLQEKWNDDLAQLAEYIARERPKRVIVEGHACWIGSDEYNQDLSERRARAVIEHLVNKHALDRGIFEVEAYGESLPEASNETPEGRKKNRRAAALVLFRVVPTL